MATHKHPRSRQHLDTHRAAIRRLEQEAAGEIDALYEPARAACLDFLDLLLSQMEQERTRLAQTRDNDTEDDDEREPPAVPMMWLDGPSGRLISLTAHVERTMTEFATHAGAVITRAHEQATVAAHDTALTVLATRSPEGEAPHRPPVGTLSKLAGRAANGQPVASLLHGVGRHTANETAKQLRIEMRAGSSPATFRTMVAIVLDQARNRAQTVLTDSLWRGNADSMMAVYRANGREQA